MGREENECFGIVDTAEAVIGESISGWNEQRSQSKSAEIFLSALSLHIV
jgi:hypothetical protein